MRFILLVVAAVLFGLNAIGVTGRVNTLSAGACVGTVAFLV